MCYILLLTSKIIKIWTVLDLREGKVRNIVLWVE